MLLLAVAPDKLKMVLVANELPPATTFSNESEAPCSTRSACACGGTVVTHPMVASKPANWMMPSEVSRTVSAPEAVVPNTVVGGLLES